MSAVSTCELNQQAVNVLRHALEKDLNGRGWLQPGYVFFVKEVAEPGIVLLIENCTAAALDDRDAFPVRLEVEWEDINERMIKNKLALAIGLEKTHPALTESFHTPSPERVKPSRSGLRLHHRLATKL
jgi:hypothetical protein